VEPVVTAGKTLRVDDKQRAMVTSLGDGIWWVNLTGVNAYLVDDDGTLTLVDAGMGWQTRHIRRAIVATGHAVGEVDRVLVTHYDFDHVDGLSNLDALDATVHIGRADYPYLTDTGHPPWSSHKGAFQRVIGWFSETPSLPVEPVEDGDTIGTFTAYETPGHTPGHVVYVSEALSVALLGDLVRESGGKLAVSPPLICYDHRRTRQSVVDLAERVGPFEVACPGHGVPFVESGRERLVACAEELTVAP
jgi:glyoxylase-like metal-dependent hydrolase (beta-lactamase superfamily II)